MLSTEVIERGASFGPSDGVYNRYSKSFDRFMGPLLSSRIAKSIIILVVSLLLTLAQPIVVGMAPTQF